MNRTMGLLFSISVVFSACSDKVDPEVLRNNVLEVYPNPMIHEGRVVVNNSTNQEALIVIFDPKGEIAFKYKLPSGNQIIQYDLRNRPSGKFHVVCKIGKAVYQREALKL